MFGVGVVILVLTLVITWVDKQAVNDSFVWILMITAVLIIPQIAKWRPITRAKAEENCDRREDEYE